MVDRAVAGCIEVLPKHTIINSKDYTQKVQEIAALMGGQEAIINNILKNGSISLVEDILKLVFSNESWFDIIAMKVIESNRLSEKLKKILNRK